MLQEATKILNSAFHNSFIKRLSLYLHDCVREEVKSSTFRNLKADKDNKWIFQKNISSRDLICAYIDAMELQKNEINFESLLSLNITFKHKRTIIDETIGINKYTKIYDSFNPARDLCPKSLKKCYRSRKNNLNHPIIDRAVSKFVQKRTQLRISIIILYLIQQFSRLGWHSPRS